MEEDCEVVVYESTNTEVYNWTEFMASEKKTKCEDAGLACFEMPADMVLTMPDQFAPQCNFSEKFEKYYI